jgi:hypothetical protein
MPSISMTEPDKQVWKEPFATAEQHHTIWSEKSNAQLSAADRALWAKF